MPPFTTETERLENEILFFKDKNVKEETMRSLLSSYRSAVLDEAKDKVDELDYTEECEKQSLMWHGMDGEHGFDTAQDAVRSSLEELKK